MAGTPRLRRHVPRPREFSEFLGFHRPHLDPVARRLASAHTIADLREIARRTTPRGPFDYADGGADAELTLRRAREAFRDIEFHPSTLRDVAHVDTSVKVTGGHAAFPFGIAPTGFTRILHAAGERAGAAAAGDAGIPFALSTVGTASPEEVRAANPTGRNWLQLYLWKDRERSLNLMSRAARSGFDTLLLTVDVPVAGVRLRDRVNGLTIPPRLSPSTVLQALPRVRWWFDFLTTEPISLASFEAGDHSFTTLFGTMFDPAVGLEDVSWIVEHWPGPVVVKGIQTLDDARRVSDLGVAGLVLSSHGGRQLDRAPIPFHLLPVVARELGRDVEVMIDSGILTGADIVASLALGARFVLVGRAYLYGLMAGGKAGADRALAILADEIIRTMQLLGVTSVGQLKPAHVTQLMRLVPRAER